ncbi:LacI family DNA-binding transcriptional regulator [Pelagicoccus mobilis]|uniref:LacI family DNA-binding transcriptional regulator n=1 Tax=Pelagicoccus mobilis TaxID=415221 RepID=A0A934VPI6_9BACT|nr:LacI family DNA-binding transcriptional regulator [Pelagicoccus mobilis]MBK1875569.1 LacI family DNA-binding transcriptional regulator [Pelagicoccus mobilis]
MSSHKRASSPKRKPTIREVSRHAGVSTATVSRVLAGLGGASEATQQRIETAVKELGYQRNRMASGLRSQRSTLVGVVIPDLQNPFFTGIVGGIEEVLHEAGYTIFLANSASDVDRERAELQMLQSERICGLLFIPSSASAEAYQDLCDGELPVVAIDRVPGGLALDSVTVANEAGAFQGVTHLIEAGYRKIGLVNGPDEIVVARERGTGYRRALQDAGLKLRPSWMASGSFQSESGYELTKAMLSKKNRPEAVFVGSFVTALGALRAVTELGLKVPDEVALMGFDDMPWAAAMNPPLSVVAQPVREIGRSAAKLLLERLEAPDLGIRSLVLNTDLVVRESCGTGV